MSNIFYFRNTCRRPGYVTICKDISELIFQKVATSFQLKGRRSQALRTDDNRVVRSPKLEGGRGGDELAGYVVPTEFFQPFSSQRDFFLWSLKNLSVSFRVKDQSQATSHSPVYSGVAEAAVQPAVGVRGGVTARCGPLWPPFRKSAQI